MAEWTKKDFSRRRYTVESDGLDKKGARLEIIVRLNGKQLAHIQAREPGMVAFVSKPTEAGFDLEILESAFGPGEGKPRFTDYWVPTKGSHTEPVADWQWDAIGIK